MAEEVTSGDVRDTEEIREAASISAFSDARAAQEHPLHASGAQI